MLTSKNEQDFEHIVEYLKEVPYEVTPSQLYDAMVLYKGFRIDEEDSLAECYDNKVYRHFISKGCQAMDVRESLARTLHDHGMHIALNDFFKRHQGRLCVGVMGGHALLRTDSMFREIVLLSKKLTELGFCMLTGGGPGAMEATHLGAWMAGRSEEEAEEALGMLAVAPSFKDKGWLASAFMVREKFPQQNYDSLGIPTWLYGHEPSTPFATHIAKFFENSIREDSILTLAYGGIVYTPGSAGTMQEIFQDAVQNHYLSFGFSSPMVFLGKKFWTQEMPVYPLLEDLVKTGKYKNLILSLTDSPEEVVDELLRFRNETT